MCYRSACAVTHPRRKAACILSRRHSLHGWGWLGAVAAAGAGFVRVIGSVRFNGDDYCPYGGVAFDGVGKFLVCDIHNHRIQVFRYSDGTHLGRICVGTRNGYRRMEPLGIAFDGAGHIVVANGSRVQVHRYSDGALVRTIGSEDRGECQLWSASGIAVDGEGNVAVFDGERARVHVFRLSDGAHIRSIGSTGSGNGQFAGDFDYGLGGLAFDSEGNLVVADSGNHRLQVLRYSDGTHVRTIGSKGEGAGQFYGPTGIAFDAAGHIVVVEQLNRRVQVLRYSDGAHVRTIGSKGHGYGQFLKPGGIAIDSDGLIVVSDTYYDRVQVFE